MIAGLREGLEARPVVDDADGRFLWDTMMVEGSMPLGATVSLTDQMVAMEARDVRRGVRSLHQSEVWAKESAGLTDIAYADTPIFHYAHYSMSSQGKRKEVTLDAYSLGTLDPEIHGQDKRLLLGVQLVGVVPRLARRERAEHLRPSFRRSLVGVTVADLPEGFIPKTSDFKLCMVIDPAAGRDLPRLTKAGSEAIFGEIQPRLQQPVVNNFAYMALTTINDYMRR